MLRVSGSFVILIGPAFFYTLGLGLLATVVAVLGSVGWTVAKDRIERARCRNWPTVPAIVDLVSVADFKPDGAVFLKPGAYNTFHRATLTYTYYYPDEQMGDYSRDFGSKENAEAWANSYKGETVKVHVDPNDPTFSVLRDEDL
jgi:hypothetical protein